MKTLYVLLILCLSLTTAVSQDNPDRIESVIVYGANPDNWKLIYTYDVDGNISNIVTDCTPSETFIPLWHKNYWIVF